MKFLTYRRFNFIDVVGIAICSQLELPWALVGFVATAILSVLAEHYEITPKEPT